MKEYKNVDEYISNFPEETQRILEKVRKTIKEVVPDAEERISYAIPTYTLPAGNVVHFGGYPRHIGFYPGAVSISNFTHLLKGYKTSKGTVQFQLDEPIPYDLIKEITAVSAEARRK
jgi:uncharacterized protein YdhG (YjbR/CyaY superfamily)